VFGAVAILIALLSLRLPVSASNVERSRVKVKLSSHAPLASLVAFYLAAAILGLAYRGTMTFLPAFMGERIIFARLDAVTAGGMMATLTLLSGAVGQYVGGRMVDHKPPEILYLIALIVSSLFLLLMVLGTSYVLVVSAVIFALFYFAVQPIQNDILARYVPAGSLGAAYGLHFLVVFGAGAFAGAGGGWLADRFGLMAVFVATLVCFVISTGLIVLLVGLRGRVAGAVDS
jgi:predicted MFS family arabinose efflux permease